MLGNCYGQKHGFVKLIVSEGSFSLELKSYILYSFTRMIERMKRFFSRIRSKIKTKLEKSPTYVKFRQIGNKLAERILSGLLLIFDFIGPVWTFLFVKTSDDKGTSETSQKVIQTFYEQGLI